MFINFNVYVYIHTHVFHKYIHKLTFNINFGYLMKNFVNKRR